MNIVLVKASNGYVIQINYQDDFGNNESEIFVADDDVTFKQVLSRVGRQFLQKFKQTPRSASADDDE